MTSRRLVSFTQRVIAAISYEVEPLDDGFFMALQSGLLANEGTVQASRDPRDAAPLDRPLKRELGHSHDTCAVLVHRTERSRLRVAAGMDHLLDAPHEAVTTSELAKDLARLTITCRLVRGQRSAPPTRPSASASSGHCWPNATR